MKRPSLQPMEHLGAGILLNEVREAIDTIGMALYGAKHCDRLARLRRQVDEFRSYMDRQACQEDGGTRMTAGVPSVQVYYGWEKDDQLTPPPIKCRSNDQARHELVVRASEVKAAREMKEPRS